MFANCQLGGMDLGFPDVCKTPVPPVPYPNIALGPTTIPVCFNTLLMCTPRHNLMSFRPITQGDTPGVGLGLVSQTVMAQQRHVTGSFTFIVKGAPHTRVTSMGPANLINCPLSYRTVPSQFKEILLCP
ncbi:DUF4150 domain-containing protein [Taylorella asinigenitalis]|uniref:Uncharacterized protein n=1 Tax=Taylorella asinigenitalis (strain MCE3) TaxID=1008459 RepID=G4QD89_TAYAM|nr:DUF4150 domain-containing protein [Taylorella asinigenitalis]AEP35906.1 hypothetical protein TASI_0115 [Taylorella asinigenitalis MCE3]